VLELTRTGSRTIARELWSHARVRIHKDNVVWRDGRVYGSSGDLGPAFFTAVDGRTGQIAWQDRTFAKASFLDADGRFILLDEDGSLALVRPAAAGLVVESRTSLMQNNAWTVPTLVGTRLYVRDRRTIVAVDLAHRTADRYGAPPSPRKSSNLRDSLYMCGVSPQTPPMRQIPGQ
jgi:hypothetical protein